MKFLLKNIKWKIILRYSKSNGEWKIENIRKIISDNVYINQTDHGYYWLSLDQYIIFDKT